MEQKSLGAFLAVLRKAQGMTQKELAEQIGVSDKTISHWERDESAPDISVLPVLADIFGVTVDELLRGEKLPQGDTTSDTLSPKGEKQLKYLMEKNFHKCKRGVLISVFTMIFGALLAILLYEWFAAPLSLIVGIFLSASMLILGIFSGNFEFALKSADFPPEMLIFYRKKLKYWMVAAILCDATLLLFVLPLALSYSLLPLGLLLQLPALAALVVMVIHKQEYFKE